MTTFMVKSTLHTHTRYKQQAINNIVTVTLFNSTVFFIIINLSMIVLPFYFDAQLTHFGLDPWETSFKLRILKY